MNSNNGNQAPPAQQKRKRYIGKVRETQTQYGVMHKIYMDNLTPEKADGTPDQYYRGNLLWMDAETGKYFRVNQLAVEVPRNGMPEAARAKGNISNIVIDIDDAYMVTPIES